MTRAGTTDFEQLAHDTGMPPELADHVLDLVYIELRSAEDGVPADLGTLLRQKFADQWSPEDDDWDGLALAAASALGHTR